MGISKRVSVLLLAVLLSFGVCAVDYLKVDALEVGGSVVWDTAINYLLGLLGLSPIAENGDKIVDFDAMRSKWVQDYEAYFYANVQPEDLPEGYTKEMAYQNWIDNVCRGNLNTIEYGAWDIFKEWAETLPSESSGGGSGGGSAGGDNYLSFNDTISFLNTYFNISIPSNSSFESYNIYAVVVLQNAYDAKFIRLFYTDRDIVNLITEADGNYFVNRNRTNSYISLNINPSPVWSGSTSSAYFNLYKNAGELNFVSNGLNFGYSSVLSNVTVLDMFGSVASASDYAVVNDKITDLQIINDYSTTTTQNVVSIDWDKIGAMISDAVGTVTGSLDRTITDALDDAQEKVAAGTMSVANYNDYVTEISNTYVYDITNETSITNPDSTVTGVITGNVENAEFVLKGLQYVFPFCIPWDIKDFVTLLVADPVAPVIEYPIYNPVTDTDEIITIDFSLWENQVRIIRYIFDFLLIIGLLLLARSLIGAGGSD